MLTIAATEGRDGGPVHVMVDKLGYLHGQAGGIHRRIDGLGMDDSTHLTGGRQVTSSTLPGRVHSCIVVNKVSNVFQLGYRSRYCHSFTSWSILLPYNVFV